MKNKIFNNLLRGFSNQTTSQTGRRLSVDRSGSKSLKWRKSRFEALEERQLLALTALSIDGIDFVESELNGTQLVGSGWSYMDLSSESGEMNLLILDGYVSTEDTISATGNLTILVSGTQNVIKTEADRNALEVKGDLTLLGSSRIGDTETLATAADNILSVSGGFSVSGQLNIEENEALTLVLGTKTVRYFVDTTAELTAAFDEAATLTDNFAILVHGDIALDSTLTAQAGAYITLLSSGNHTISKGAGFDSSTYMFVVSGKKGEAESMIQIGLATGMGTNTLSIDGGAVWTNITSAENTGVISSVAMINVLGTFRMFDGAILQNAHNSNDVDEDKACGAVFVNNTKTNFSAINPKTLETEANGNGGGVFEMFGGVITQCYAYRGGGVGVTGQFTLDGGTINDCYAYLEGGGVRSRGMFIFKSGTISHCAAVSMTGGNNTADTAKGGGVHNSKYGYMHMSGGTIVDCYSIEYGGGIYVGGVGLAYTFLNGGRIEKNRALLGGGMAANSSLYLSNGLYVGGNDTFTLKADGSLADLQLDDAHGDGLYVFYQPSQALVEGKNTLPNIHVTGGVKIDPNNDVYIAMLMYNVGDYNFPTIPVKVDGELTGDGLCMLISGNGNDYKYYADYSRNDKLRYTPIVTFTDTYYRSYAKNHGIADWRSIDPEYANVYAWSQAGFIAGSAYTMSITDGTTTVTKTVTADESGVIFLNWDAFEGETTETVYRISQDGQAEYQTVTYRQSGCYNLYNRDMPITQSSKFILVSQEWELSTGSKLSVEGVNVNAYNRSEEDSTIRQLDTPNTLCLYDVQSTANYQARVGEIYFMTVDDALEYISIHADEFSGHDYDEAGADGYFGTSDDLSPAVLYLYHNSTLGGSHVVDCDLVIVSATDESFQTARYTYEQDFLWEHYSSYDANGDGVLKFCEIPDEIMNSLNLRYPEYQWYKNYRYYNSQLSLTSDQPLNVTTVTDADGKSYRYFSKTAGSIISAKTSNGTAVFDELYLLTDSDSNIVESITLADGTVLESYVAFGAVRSLLSEGLFRTSELTYTVPASVTVTDEDGNVTTINEVFTLNAETGNILTARTDSFTATEDVTLTFDETFSPSTMQEGSNAVDELTVSAKGQLAGVGTVDVSGSGSGEVILDSTSGTNEYTVRMNDGTLVRTIGYNGNAVDTASKKTFEITSITNVPNSSFNGSTSTGLFSPNCYVSATIGDNSYYIKQSINNHFKPYEDAVAKASYEFVSCDFEDYYYTANGNAYVSGTFVVRINDFSCELVNQNDANDKFTFTQSVTLTARFTGAQLSFIGNSLYHIDSNVPGGSLTVDDLTFDNYVVDPTTGKTADVSIHSTMSRVKFGVSASTKIHYVTPTSFFMTIMGTTYEMDPVSFTTGGSNVNNVVISKDNPFVLTGRNLIGFDAEGNAVYNSIRVNVGEANVGKTKSGDNSLTFTKGYITWTDNLGDFYSISGLSTPDVHYYLDVPVSGGFNFAGNNISMTIDGLVAQQSRSFLIHLSGDFTLTLSDDFDFTATVYDGYEKTTQEMNAVFTIVNGSTMTLGANDGTTLILEGYYKHALAGTFFLVNSPSATLVMNNSTTIQNLRSTYLPAVEVNEGIRESVYYGGAVTVMDGRFVMNGGTIRTCCGYSSGAVAVNIGGTFDFNAGTIEDNVGAVATAKGEVETYSGAGAIYNYGGDVTIARTSIYDEKGKKLEAIIQDNSGKFGGIYNEEVLHQTTNDATDSLTFRWTAAKSICDSDVFLVYVDGVYLDTATGLKDGSGENGHWTYNAATFEYTYTCYTITTAVKHDWKVIADYAEDCYGRGTATRNEDGTLTIRWTDPAGRSENLYFNVKIDGEVSAQVCIPDAIGETVSNTFGSWVASLNVDRTSWDYTFTTTKVYDTAVHSYCIAGNNEFFASVEPSSECAGSIKYEWDRDPNAVSYKVVTTKKLAEGETETSGTGGHNGNFSVVVPNVSDNDYGTDINTSWSYNSETGKFTLNHTNGLVPQAEYNIEITPVYLSEEGNVYDGTSSVGTVTATTGGRLAMYWSDPLATAHQTDVVYYIYVDGIMIHDVQYAETGVNNNSLWTWTDTNNDGLGEYCFLLTNFAEGEHDVRIQVVWPQNVFEGQGTVTATTEGSNQGALSVSWEPSSFTYVNHIYDITVNGVVFEEGILYGTSGTGKNGSWVFADGLFTYTTTAENYSTTGSYLCVVTDNRLGTVFTPDSDGRLSFSWKQSDDAVESTIYQTSVEQTDNEYIPNAVTWRDTTWSGNYGTCTYDAATMTYTWTSHAGLYQTGFSYGGLVHAVLDGTDVNLELSNPTKNVAITAANLSISWIGDAESATDGVIYGLYVTNPNTGYTALCGRISALTSGTDRYGTWTYDAATRQYDFVSNVPVFAEGIEYHCEIIPINFPTPESVEFKWIDAAETNQDAIYIGTLLYNNEVVATQTVGYHAAGFYDAETGYYTVKTDLLTQGDGYEWYVTKILPDYLYSEGNVVVETAGRLTYSFAAPDFAVAQTQLGVYLDGILLDVITNNGEAGIGNNGSWTFADGNYIYTTHADYQAGSHAMSVSAVVTTDADGNAALTWTTMGSIEYKVFLGREYQGTVLGTTMSISGLHASTVYQWTLGTDESLIAEGSKQKSATGSFELIWADITGATEGDYYIIEANGNVYDVCAWRDAQYYNAETNQYNLEINDMPTVQAIKYTVRLVKASASETFFGTVQADTAHYLQFSWDAAKDETERTLYTIYIDDVATGTVGAGQSLTTDKGKVTYLNGVYSYKSFANAYDTEFSMWRIGVSDTIDPNVSYDLSVSDANLTLYGGTIRNNTNGTTAAIGGNVNADAHGNITVEWFGVYDTEGNPFNVIVDGVLLGTLTPRTESVTDEATRYGKFSYDAATNKYTYVYEAGFIAGSTHEWLLTGYATIDSVDDIERNYLFQYDSFVQTTVTNVVQYYTDQATGTKVPLTSSSVFSFVPSDVRLAPRTTTEWSADGFTETITTVRYEEPIRGNIAIYNLGNLTFAGSDINIETDNIVYLGYDRQNVQMATSETTGESTTEIVNTVRKIDIAVESLDNLTLRHPCVLDTFTNAPKTLLATVDADGNGVASDYDVKETSILMNAGGFAHFTGSIIQNAEFDMDIASDTYLSYAKVNELVLSYGEIKYVNCFSYYDGVTNDKVTIFQVDTVSSDDFVGGQKMALESVNNTFGENGAIRMAYGNKSVSTVADSLFTATWTDTDYATVGTKYTVNINAVTLSGTVLTWTDVIDYQTSGTSQEHGSWTFENGVYTYTSESLALGSYTWYVETSEVVSDTRTVTVSWKDTGDTNSDGYYYLYANNKFVKQVAVVEGQTLYTEEIDVAADLAEGEYCNWTVMSGKSGMSTEGVAFSQKTNPVTKDKYYFVGWNTKMDGSGTWIYPTSATLNTIPVTGYDVVYAMWSSNIVNTLNDSTAEINTSDHTVKKDEWLSLRAAIQIALHNETLKGTPDYDIAKSTITFELNPELWEQASEWAEQLGWTLSGSTLAGEQYSAKCFPKDMVFVMTLGMLPTITSTLKLDATDLEQSGYAHVDTVTGKKDTSIIFDGRSSGDASDIATKNAAVGFIDTAWTAVDNALAYEIYLDGELSQTVYADLSGYISTSGSNKFYLDKNGVVYTYNASSQLFTMTFEIPETASVNWSVNAVFADTVTRTTVADTDGNVTLDWSLLATAGATSYRVYVDGKLNETVSETTFSLTGLESGQSISWYVEPIVEMQNTGTSVSAAQSVWYRATMTKTVTVYTETYVGGVISTQEKHADNGGRVVLSWSETAKATGYRVYINGTYIETVDAMKTNGTVITAKGSLTYTDGGYEYTWNQTLGAGVRYSWSLTAQMTETTSTVTTLSADKLSKSGIVYTATETVPSGMEGHYTKIVTTTTYGVSSAKVTEGDRAAILKINTGATGSSAEHPVVILDIDFVNGGAYNGLGGTTTADGGGIVVSNLTTYVDIEKANFVDCIGRYGGAIRNYGIMTLSDSTFTSTLTQGNSTESTASNVYVARYGGAVYNCGTLKASGLDISGMWVNGNGGGISNNSLASGATSATNSLGRLTLSESKIQDCYAIGTGNQQYGYGGGLGNWGEATISGDTRILNCYASENGGGITNGYYANTQYGTQSSMTIESSMLMSNTAAYFGGGIINGTYLTVAGSSILSNVALNRNGGGVANTLYESAEEYLRKANVVTPTTSTENSGGPVSSSEEAGALVMSITSTGSINPTTADTTNDDKAAGILSIESVGSSITYINGNKSVKGYGGGISDWGLSLTIANEISISDNEALYGGGIRTNQEIRDIRILGFADSVTGQKSTNKSVADNNSTSDIFYVGEKKNVQSTTSFLLVNNATEGSELVINNGSGTLKTISATDTVTSDSLGLSNGENTLVMQVRNADGATSDPITMTVSVSKVVPTIAVEKTVYADSRVLKLDMEVFGADNPQRWVVSWGDGKTSEYDSSTSTLSQAHCYNDAGHYTISLALTDNNGNTTTHFLAVHNVTLPAAASLMPSDVHATEDGTDSMAELESPVVLIDETMTDETAESAFVMSDSLTVATSLFVPAPAFEVKSFTVLPISRCAVPSVLPLVADRFFSAEEEETKRGFFDGLFMDENDETDVEWSLDFTSKSQGETTTESYDSFFSEF